MLQEAEDLPGPKAKERDDRQEHRPGHIVQAREEDDIDEPGMGRGRGRLVEEAPVDSVGEEDGKGDDKGEDEEVGEAAEEDSVETLSLVVGVQLRRSAKQQPAYLL